MIRAYMLLMGARWPHCTTRGSPCTLCAAVHGRPPGAAGKSGAYCAPDPASCECIRMQDAWLLQSTGHRALRASRQRPTDFAFKALHMLSVADKVVVRRMVQGWIPVSDAASETVVAGTARVGRCCRAGITGMSLLVTPFLMQACRHILPDVEGSPVQVRRCRGPLVPGPATHAPATCFDAQNSRVVQTLVYHTLVTLTISFCF